MCGSWFAWSPLYSSPLSPSRISHAWFCYLRKKTHQQPQINVILTYPFTCLKMCTPQSWGIEKKILHMWRVSHSPEIINPMSKMPNKYPLRLGAQDNGIVNDNDWLIALVVLTKGQSKQCTYQRVAFSPCPLPVAFFFQREQNLEFNVANWPPFYWFFFNVEQLIPVSHQWPRWHNILPFKSLSLWMQVPHCIVPGWLAFQTIMQHGWKGQLSVREYVQLCYN